MGIHSYPQPSQSFLDIPARVHYVQWRYVPESSFSRWIRDLDPEKQPIDDRQQEAEGDVPIWRRLHRIAFRSERPYRLRQRHFCRSFQRNELFLWKFEVSKAFVIKWQGWYHLGQYLHQSRSARLGTVFHWQISFVLCFQLTKCCGFLISFWWRCSHYESSIWSRRILHWI